MSNTATATVSISNGAPILLPPPLLDDLQNETGEHECKTESVDNSTLASTLASFLQPAAPNCQPWLQNAKIPTMTVANLNGEAPKKRKRGRPPTISGDSDDEWIGRPTSSSSHIVTPSTILHSSTPSMDAVTLQKANTVNAVIEALRQRDANLNTQLTGNSSSSEPASPGLDLNCSSNGDGNGGNNVRVQAIFGQLQPAFAATVARDYERAAKVVREVVKTDHPFGADELELIDHVFACVLNTAHYDETMIAVCWEWIDSIEREPRVRDARAISSSQLSVYYAYHTISRVQERMPRKPDYTETRQTTWMRADRSFRYFWLTGAALWRPFELDRLDVLVNWTYLALQFADVVEDMAIEAFETMAEETRGVLNKSIVVEHSHQTNERFATVERNLKEIATARAEKARRGRSGAAVQTPTNRRSLGAALDAIVEANRKKEHDQATE